MPPLTYSITTKCMGKQQAEKCASHKPKYYGDARNPHVNPDYAATLSCDCDGYHTFTELYDHRITLFIALARKIQLNDDLTEAYGDSRVWRSKRHSDGELCFGTGTQFVLGICTDECEQITYHVPIERWDETGFAETLKKAPEFDGHTSDDVLERLKRL